MHITSEDIIYEFANQSFKGTVYYDANSNEKKPGILVVHEFWGNNEFSKRQAERLASEGYIAFSIDMYGDGQVTEKVDVAMSMLNEASQDPEQLKGRFMSAYNALTKMNFVDTSRVAAIGYCFGGSVVLNLMRMGAPLKGVVSIHGVLESNLKPTKSDIKVRIFHGSDDQMVTREHLIDFMNEMMDSDIEVSATCFPNVGHSFSNPDASNIGVRNGLPIGYDKIAADESWNGAIQFFRNLLK